VTTADGGRFGAASGEFATVTEDFTAPLAVVTEGAKDLATGLSTACSALAPGSLSGMIALISRGTCSFSMKIRNAQEEGAVAVLVVNNLAGDPIAMASDDTPDQPTVPAYMVGLEDGLVLATKNGVLTTIGFNLEYFRTKNDNIMASFSALGPTVSVRAILTLVTHICHARSAETKARRVAGLLASWLYVAVSSRCAP